MAKLTATWYRHDGLYKVLPSDWVAGVAIVFADVDEMMNFARAFGYVLRQVVRT